MQIIMLTGRLVKDAILKSNTVQGVKTEFVSFTLACNENRGDSTNATFYDVTMPKTGVFEYLKSGQAVSVVGRFRYSVSKDSDGKEYHHLNVSAMNVELSGGKKKDSDSQEDLPQ